MAGFYRKELGKRLIEAWPAGAIIGGVAVSLLLGRLCSRDLETVFRYGGLILEFFGLVLVVVGLDDIRRRFRGESFWASITGWFGRLPSIINGPKSQNISMPVIGSSSTLFGGSATMTVSRNQTIEERLVTLEGEIRHLKEEMDDKASKLKQEIASAKSQIEDKIDHANARIDKVDSKINDYAVGGMSLEIVGVFWIFFGIVFASLPEEIATVIG